MVKHEIVQKVRELLETIKSEDWKGRTNYICQDCGFPQKLKEILGEKNA